MLLRTVPLTLSLVLSLLYVHFFVSSAWIELEVHGEKRTLLKLYWADEGQSYAEDRMAQAMVEPGQSRVHLRLGDMTSHRLLRIDPSEHAMTWLQIRRVTLRQNGVQTLELTSPEELARLQPLRDIGERFHDGQGLWVEQSGNDGQLEWRLPILEQHLSLPLELARLVCVVLGVFALAWCARTAGLTTAGWVPLAMALVLGLIATMALVSRYNAHPDEFIHIEAAQYYQQHWLPPEIGDPAIRHTYSDYGNSRLHSGEIYYWLAGKVLAALQPLQLPPHLTLRSLNLLLWAGLLLWVMGRPSACWLALPLLISPQIWYVFSYVNSEAFALVVVMAMAWQVVSSDSAFSRLALTDDRSWLRSLPGLGGLLLLFLLSKQTFLPFVLFLVPFLLWRLCCAELGPFARVWRRWLALAGVGLLGFALVQGADYAVNGLDRKAKIARAQEEFAIPMFKASTPLDKKHVDLQRRARGISLQHFLQVDRWGEKIFRTSFGVYGYLTVSAPFGYYDLIRRLGPVVLVLLLGGVLLRGSRADKVLALLTTLAMAACIGIVLHEAWTVNFQGQGRYFFPIIPMLAVLLARTFHLLPAALFQSAVLAMFFLSVYSYCWVGLHGIVARYGL